VNIIRSIEAWYPAFHLGHEPQAVQCELHDVEANGRRYTKTPFAMLDAHGTDDLERQIGRGYYATKADCKAYLDFEYPHAIRAQPIMEALYVAQYHHGTIVGPARVADTIGVSVHHVHQFARGHRSISLKRLKEALKLLDEDTDRKAKAYELSHPRSAPGFPMPE
jgi:hypothetical protein